MHHHKSTSLLDQGQATHEIAFEVFENDSRLSQKAAEIIFEAVRQKPDLLLCLATGQTPTQTYEKLTSLSKGASESFQLVRMLKLDEWGGIAMDNPATCEQYLQNRIVQPLGMSQDQCVGFESNSKDPQAECKRIQYWIERRGPIDLCLLGIGGNGHIAFNEPGSTLSPFSHVAELSSHSLQHPMLSASSEQPRYGLTLGMAEIMQARQILLLISGSHKRSVLNRLRQRKISTQFPASLLWLHPQVLCLCDREAADESLSS